MHSLLKHHMSLPIAYRMVLLLVALHQNRAYFKGLLAKLEDQKILSQVVQYVFATYPKRSGNESLQSASKVLLLQLFIRDINHTMIKKQAMQLTKSNMTNELSSLLSQKWQSGETSDIGRLTHSLLDLADPREPRPSAECLVPEQLDLWSRLFHHLLIYSNNNTLYGNVIYDAADDNRP